MLLALALLAQTAPTLETDNARAGLTCAMAVSVGETNAPPIRLTAQVSAFMMEAAKASPNGKPFLDRVTELSNEDSRTLPSLEAAKALLPLCDKRFPLARANGTATLPTDSFRRDLMCLGTLSLLLGAAQELEKQNGDAGPLDKIQSALAPVSDRLNDDVVTAHGIADEKQFANAMGEQVKASLALGNVEVVARACGASGLD